jgi:hypothetical protein
VALLIALSISSWAETKKLTTMGRYTFARVRGNVPSQDVMKMLVTRYAADLKYGFEQAGYPDLYEPFLAQLEAANFTEKSLPVGTVFPWMLFRSQGKVKVVKDIEWAGKDPLEVYSFTVNKDYKNYEFIMPRPCGNVALLNITEAVPPAVCDLKVTPAKVNVNEVVNIDMSGSQYATSMEVSLYDPAGALITTQALTPDNPKWQTKFDKPGDYVLKAKVANQRGEVTGPSCEAKVHVNFPPVCALTITCTECKDYVGKPIVFDASGSSDPDGQIVKANFEVMDSKGAVIDTFMDTEAPFVWEKVFDKAGNYTVSVTVFDDMGIAAGGTEPCRIPFTVTQKRLFFLVEGGPGLLRGTYTGMLWARLGLLYKIVPGTLDFVLSAGPGFPVKGDPWKIFVMGNALLSVHGGPAFLAGGIGFTTKEQETRKGGLDLVGQVGVDLFKTSTNSVGSIFGELRAPITPSGRTFDESHMLLLGFRYIF